MVERREFTELEYWKAAANEARAGLECQPSTLQADYDALLEAACKLSSFDDLQNILRAGCYERGLSPERAAELEAWRERLARLVGER